MIGFNQVRSDLSFLTVGGRSVGAGALTPHLSLSFAIFSYNEGTTMNTSSMIEKYDAATIALEQIRILAGMHHKHCLDPEEISLICDLIYEISTLPEA